MAFILQRPFAVVNVLKQSAPRGSQSTCRSFQSQARGQAKQAFNYAKPASPLRAFANGKQDVFRNAFKQSSRSYETSAPSNPIAQGNLTQRLIYGGGTHIRRQHFNRMS